MTLKELEKQVKELQKQIKELKKKKITIDDLDVGESFIYKGHNYTKLNKENYCIIDDYDEDFMRCIFDPITNNYDESIIKQYINSERFIDKLGVNTEDINYHYDCDFITLLSKEEYEEYRDLIKDYETWWATRSAYSSNGSSFCIVTITGTISSYSVYNSLGVRVSFNLKPNTPVDRKGNKE